MTTPFVRTACAITTILLALGTLMLSACSSAPKAPDWQLEAKGAMDRSVTAYLEGNARVDLAELTRARAQLSSTGRADLVASAELLHCAAHVASITFEPCAGFAPLRPDATAAQRAYADYLGGKITPDQIALLPASQRVAASRSANDAGPVQGMEDPLSTLVAAGVLLQTGKANPATIAQAVDTASNQGWRRPLLAWLGVQAQRATQAGQVAEAERLQRRIKLVENESPPAR